MDFYPWLKALHILLAIVAVGFNMSYGIWQARAGRDQQHMGYALRTIKFMDDRIANPAYVGLAIVGVILVLIGLYVLLVIIALGLYSPVLRRQIAAYEATGGQTAEFTALSGRSRMLGAVLGAIVVVIILLMVIKPGA